MPLRYRCCEDGKIISVRYKVCYMNQKTKKIFNIVVDVLVCIILALVVFITVNVIMSGDKGYTSFFGTTFVAVESDSMKGDKEDNFSKGDLIRVRILSDEEKKNLKEGDIITFYDVINGTRQLNTHRIVRVSSIQDGVVYYTTKGDNNVVEDPSLRADTSVIGIYEGKIGGLGNVVSFFHSSAGFFVCVVLPSLLIVAYFAFNLYKTVKESKAEGKEDEKERMKQELLKELQAEGKIPVTQKDTDETETVNPNAGKEENRKEAE